MAETKENLLSSINNADINGELTQNDDVTMKSDVKPLHNVIHNKSFMILQPFVLLLQVGYYMKATFMLGYGSAWFGGCKDIKSNNDCNKEFNYDLYILYSNLCLSIAGFIALLSSGIIGQLSDKYGRKRFLIFQAITMLITVIGVILWNNMYFYLMLICIVSLNGSTVVTTPVINAYVADVLNEKNRIIGYGILYGNVGISLLVGVIISFIVSKIFNDRACFFVMGILFIIAIIYCKVFIHETVNGKTIRNNNTGNHSLNPFKILTHINDNKVLLWIAMIQLLVSFAETGVLDISTGVFGDAFNENSNDGANEISLMFMLGFGFGLIIAPSIILPILKKYFNDYSLLVITIFTLGVSFLLMASILFIKQKFLIPIVSFIFSIGILCFAAMNTILSKYTDPTKQGTIFGVIFCIRGITSTISPFGMAFIYNSLNEYNYIIFIMAFLLNVISILFVVFPLRNAINIIERKITNNNIDI